jgi:hypothetical protein
MSEFGTGSSVRRLSLRRRFDKTVKAKPQSPSYGVRAGFIRNPNWPPGPGVQMPTDRRLAKRVEYTFEVLYAGRAIAVQGDVSATGAMFVLDRVMPTSQVELAVRVPAEREPRRVSADVVRTSYKGPYIAHHVKFLHPEQFDHAMEQIVASGAVPVR